MIKRSIQAQIAEAKRELQMRKEVYGRRVSMHKMKQGESDELILIQENIIATLEWCRDNRGLCVEFEKARKADADHVGDANKMMQP
ncbi:MAG: hypothetical protein AB7O39_03425 [Flavobacteriaceae bacterium]